MPDAPLPPVPPEPTLATQSAHPWRATARTVVQTIVALGVVLPIAAGVVNEHLGRYLPDNWEAALLAVAAFVAAIAAVLTKVMAIPAVDAWLERIGLSSRPSDPHRPPSPEGA